MWEDVILVDPDLIKWKIAEKKVKAEDVLDQDHQVILNLKVIAMIGNILYN
jgi:hypothetical protein